jgi:hypothetical protein
MTKEERDYHVYRGLNREKIYELINKILATDLDKLDEAEAVKEFPIDIATAQSGLIAFGKEWVLNSSLNFSFVEKELGPNWIEDTLSKSSFSHRKISNSCSL